MKDDLHNLYCLECKTQIIQINNDHDATHHIIKLDELNSLHISARKKKQGELLSAKNLLEIYDSDLLLLEKVIEEKKKKLNQSLTALNKIEEKLKEGKETLKNVKNECKKILKNFIDNKATEEDFKSLHTKLNEGDIVKFKNELKKVSGDANLYCIGESLLLNIMIENERIILDTIKGMNESKPIKSNKLVMIEEKLSELLGNKGESANKVDDMDMIEKVLNEEIELIKKELKRCYKQDKKKDLDTIEELKDTIEELKGKVKSLEDDYKNEKDRSQRYKNKYNDLKNKSGDIVIVNPSKTTKPKKAKKMPTPVKDDSD